MWTRNNEITTVNLEDLVEARVDSDAIAKRGTSLRDASMLHLTVRGGQHVIHLEPGQPFSGVWNVLLTISLRNKRNASLN